MSIVFAIALIVIAWMLSTLVDAIPYLWHALSILPLWIEGILLAGILSWLISDRAR